MVMVMVMVVRIQLRMRWADTGKDVQLLEEARW